MKNYETEVRERFGNIALAHSANAIYQQSAAPSIRMLPLKKPIIDFPSHLATIPNKMMRIIAFIII